MVADKGIAPGRKEGRKSTNINGQNAEVGPSQDPWG